MDDGKARRKRFGQLLQKVRKNAGITQEQAEERLEKGNNALSRFENGHTQMGVQDFEDVLAMCGSDIDIYEFFPKLVKPKNKGITMSDLKIIIRRLPREEKVALMHFLVDELSKG